MKNLFANTRNYQTRGFVKASDSLSSIRTHSPGMESICSKKFNYAEINISNILTYDEQKPDQAQANLSKSPRPMKLRSMERNFDHVFDT